MNYKPYPAYKDSGVEWLGEIPEGWNIRKLGLSSDLIVPMRDKPEQLDGDIPWIRIEDFDGRIISESKSQQGVSQDTIDKMNLKIIPKGSVLCTCSCSMGTVAIVGAPLVTNQTFIGIYPKSYVTEFLAYLMECSREELSRIATGAIQTYLSRNDFSNLRLPLPPLSTQKAIAAFLDARTARIDGLVQDYEELVSLLKEKRQTLVSHAVTRGLSEVVSLDDPDFGEWARPVAFKDSGIEWLGEIPEEWEAKKLTNTFTSKKTYDIL